MKLISILLSCFFFLLMPLSAQTPNPAAALKDAVETERAFSKTSELKGTRDSFLAFIADDGILFRPTAVNGKKWLLEHPTPPSTSGKRSWLSWQPTFADVAASADMAYTTGPWQFRQDIKDEKAVAFGHFVTVWKKQGDGSWRFAIDLGITHPEPAAASDAWQPSDSKRDSKINSVAGPKELQNLLDLDTKFSRASESLGAEKALNNFSADQIRLYRNGRLPMISREVAVQGLSLKDLTWTWTPTSADVSRANDLGYSYGMYEVKDRSQKTTEKGNYLRIWKRIGDNWKVVVDVADPLPLDEKN